MRVAAVGNAVCEVESLRIEEYLDRLGQVLDESASIAHFHTAMSIPRKTLSFQLPPSIYS